MAVDNKVFEKINKLIGLSVGTTYDGERANAAVAAVKLMHDHGLIPAVPVAVVPKRKIARRPAAAPPPPAPVWVEVPSPRNAFCILCRGPLRAGETAHFSTERSGFMHLDFHCYTEWND